MAIRNEAAAKMGASADAGIWYVARTEARRESEVVDALLSRDIEAYAPVRTRFAALSKFHRKPRPVSTPLFPRFVFVRGISAMALIDELLTIRQADGLLCCRAVPLRVRPAEIDLIQAKEKAGLFDSTREVIQKGPNGLMLLSNVEIIDGPWTFHGGIVRAIDGQNGRATVEVSVFGRATPVEMPVDLLRILG